MRETRAGNPVKRDVVKLGDYLDYWCDQVAPSQVRPSTLASYETFIRLHIKPRLGSKRLDRLTPTDIRGFLRVMSTEPGRHGKPLSTRSVQYLHAILRNVLQHAMREELLVRNVARLVQVPTGQPREVQPLTRQEVSALLTAARGRRLYAAYVLMLAVGLRKGEALGLRWSDVDLDARTLRVRSTLQRLNGELHISAPKTSRSRRTLVLPLACVVALRWQRLRLRDEQSTAGRVWDPDGLIFVTSEGRPNEPRNLNRDFYALCKKAGITRHVRVHDLRHTCATILLSQGVDPRVIMDTLGHSTIGMTLNTYAHVLPAANRAAAAQMDSALDGWRQR